jgi:GNAT superfamily N-acetyltransferase
VNVARPVGGADRSVRVGWVADAAAMATVQVRAWREGQARLLPSSLSDALDLDATTAAWSRALRRPPSARHRVLVALEHGDVVGFCALIPAADPDAHPGRDAEMTVLAVDPAHQRAGHGSRLLAAVADTARADGFSRVTTWVLAQDDALRSFLVSAGWAPDGAHREMLLSASPAVEPADPEAGETASARQVRLHTCVETT